MKILALTSTENESGTFSYLPLLMLGIGVATIYINLHIMVSSSTFYLCRIVLLFLNPDADDLFGMARYPELRCPSKLVSIETTQTGTGTETSFGTIRNKMFVSVVSLLYRNREFRCFRKFRVASVCFSLL